LKTTKKSPATPMIKVNPKKAPYIASRVTVIKLNIMSVVSKISSVDFIVSFMEFTIVVMESVPELIASVIEAELLTIPFPDSYKLLTAA
jgi:hypothetical protein